MIAAMLFMSVSLAVTIRELYLGRNKSKLNAENSPRLSLGRVVMCASWIVLSIPFLGEPISDFGTVLKLPEEGFTYENVRGFEINKVTQIA